MELRECLECGEVLRGRIDKNFVPITVEILTIIK